MRGPNTLDKLSILSSDLERLNIRMCGLLETKWTGTGYFTTEDSHTLLFSGQAECEHHGVAMWVHKSVVPCLESYNTMSSRVISVIFASKPKDVTVVQCYAPTADKPDKKEQFYKEVKHMLAETPNQKTLLITGDFSARVEENRVKIEVLRQYGNGERNERGKTLVQSISWLSPIHSSTYITDAAIFGRG